MDDIERANHAAIVEALVGDAHALGLKVEHDVDKSLGKVVRVTPSSGGELTFQATKLSDLADLALFIVEERLCKAGKIR